MIKEQLTALKNMVDNELDDVLEASLQSIDLNTIGEFLLSQTDGDVETPGFTVREAIDIILHIAQYVETDTTMESVMSDELYDQLHERYKDFVGHGLVGTPTMTSKSNKPLQHHKYPELRGSLDKVHFIHESDVPEKDSRKSLEGWINGVIRKYNNVGLEMPSLIYVMDDFKFDGLSGVFECTGNKVNALLTRKDTDANLGVVVTHILNGLSVSELFGGMIPEALYNSKFSYGIKTEMLVLEENLQKMKESMSVTKAPKNRRSASSMIVNTSKEEYNPSWLQYMTFVPLQIALENPNINIDDMKWQSVGEVDGRTQLIRYNEDNITTIKNGKFEELHVYLEHVAIPITKVSSDEMGLPIDGTVITLLNKELISVLGRKNNINQFQIAYKFPAGIKKTKIKNVTFPVGPVAGTITPLAEVEPVIIMGNTITSVGLSNCDKLDRLHLHIGDEVMVKYDIIPTLYKTEECVEADTPLIISPKECPICHQPLTINNLTVRCTNLECDSRVSGKIANYITKIGIQGIGLATVEDLIANDIIHNIGDLYRLEHFRDKIVNLQGYGVKSYDNMVKAINTKLQVYPHELLGSLGIPDIGRTMMKKICTVYSMSDILDTDEGMIGKLIHIDGIGEKSAIKIMDGIDRNKSIIHDLLQYITIKEYDNQPSNFKVLFTGDRDKNFANYLVENYHAEIASGYSKSINLLIIPDREFTSGKITKAREDGITILKMSKAKAQFKYKE